MASVLVLVGSLSMLVCTVIMLIAAFKRSVGTGFLSLCVPFWIYFFAFKQYQSPKKKVVISIWLAAHVLYIIGVVLAAKAQMGAMQ